jgi:hypothetical protein
VKFNSDRSKFSKHFFIPQPGQLFFKKPITAPTLSLPFTLKSISRQKKKNYENSNISPCQNIIFKRSSKRNQNPSRYDNSITNSQVSTQAKISSFKNPHMKLDLLPRDQNPLSYYTP